MSEAVESKPRTRDRSQGSTRRVVLYALLGALLASFLALADAHRVGIGWVALIQPGEDGGLVETLESDFPSVDIPEGRGHDGQYFYAVARSPTDLDSLAEDLDRARYRLQRPLFSALAWMFHPFGGGYGLLASIIFVGVSSVVLLGLAAGFLATRLGGPPALALIVPLLPGPIWSLRLGLADNLALGLTLLFLWSAIGGGSRAATLFAVFAVMTKEAMLVVVVAHAVVRRERSAAIPALVSIGTAGAWWIMVRAVVESTGRQVEEIGSPFGGVSSNLDLWIGGEHRLAGSMVAAAFFLAVLVAVMRGPSHPLFAVVLASALFLAFLGPDVLGLDHNGTRAVTPTWVLALVALATASPTRTTGEGSAVRPKRDHRADLLRAGDAGAGGGIERAE